VHDSGVVAVRGGERRATVHLEWLKAVRVPRVQVPQRAQRVPSERAATLARRVHALSAMAEVGERQPLLPHVRVQRRPEVPQLVRRVSTMVRVGVRVVLLHRALELQRLLVLLVVVVVRARLRATHVWAEGLGTEGLRAAVRLVRRQGVAVEG